MKKERNLDWFRKEVAPNLNGYELNYKSYKDGDFGSLDQVEFNSKKIGGNIDFWGLNWLGVFVWNYEKEEQILNILLEPHQNEEKEQIFIQIKELLNQ